MTQEKTTHDYDTAPHERSSYPFVEQTRHKRLPGSSSERQRTAGLFFARLKKGVRARSITFLGAIAAGSSSAACSAARSLRGTASRRTAAKMEHAFFKPLRATVSARCYTASAQKHRVVIILILERKVPIKRYALFFQQFSFLTRVIISWTNTLKEHITTVKKHPQK